MSGGESPAFLLEIGCEEIPDWMIVPALEFLKTEFRALTLRERLGDPEFKPALLGTPRRLSMLARGLLARQEDRIVEVTGPRLDSAYDSQGRPTRALEGFARSQGVSAEAILRVTTPRGECVAARRQEKGRGAGEVLSAALPGIIGSIPFGRTKAAIAARKR